MSASREAIDRHALLADYGNAERELLALLASPDAPDPTRTRRCLALTQRIGHLREEYRARVPLLRVSRCPFSGAVIRHSVDTLGLDGLWWNHADPVRPEESLPPTFFALTGAVQLWDPVGASPFLCNPGPDAPYVLPRLLANTNLRAVVSSCAVGHHRAFAIVYTADPVPTDMARVNTWGAGHYTFHDRDGRLCRTSWEPSIEDADFDLAPWIRSGRLLWIAPDDATLQLRSVVSGCPYLSVGGAHAFVRMLDNTVWTDAPELSP